MAGCKHTSAGGGGETARAAFGGRWHLGRDGPESPGSQVESGGLVSGHRWISVNDLDGRLDKMKTDLEVQFRAELQGQMAHVLEQLRLIAANVGSKPGEDCGKAIEFSSRSSRKVPTACSGQPTAADAMHVSHKTSHSHTTRRTLWFADLQNEQAAHTNEFRDSAIHGPHEPGCPQGKPLKIEVDGNRLGLGFATLALIGCECVLLAPDLVSRVCVLHSYSNICAAHCFRPRSRTLLGCSRFAAFGHGAGAPQPLGCAAEAGASCARVDCLARRSRGRPQPHIAGQRQHNALEQARSAAADGASLATSAAPTKALLASVAT